MTGAEAAAAVAGALALGVLGDRCGGLEELGPVLRQGPDQAYAALAALALAASRPGRMASPGAEVFVMRVARRDGRPLSVDELPGPLRTAVQFVGALANDDHDTARALFLAVADYSVPRQAPDLADFMYAVFDLAVIGSVRSIQALRERG